MNPILFTIIALTIFMSFYSYRSFILYREGDKEAFIPALEIALASITLSMASYGLFAEDAPLYLTVFSAPLSYTSFLLSYFSSIWLLTGAHPNPLNNRITVITAISTLALMVIDLLRDSNRESLFLYKGVIQATALYYAYYIFGYIIAIYLYTQVFLLYFKTSSPEDIFFKIRRLSGMAAWMTLIIAGILAELNIILHILYGEAFRRQMSMLQMSVTPVSSLFLIINLLRKSHISIIINPYILFKERKLTRVLLYLHAQYTKVIPEIRYIANKRLTPRTLAAEIEHGRYLLLTHEPRIRPITPQEEAVLLYHRIWSKQAIVEVGPCEPQVIASSHDNHNARVAKHLARLEEGGFSMMRDNRLSRSVSTYIRPLLPWYDITVTHISNQLAWGCPAKNILELYNANVSANHLDIGVGSGYYLNKCQFPSHPHITLVDLSKDALSFTSHRIRRYGTQTLQSNVLEPLPLDRKFNSIAINYVLHCVPGSMSEKAGRIFSNISPWLDGVLFGTTILQEASNRNWLAARLMGLYNARGIFSNNADTIVELEQSLRDHFQHVRVWQIGAVAFFTAEKRA